MYSIPITTIYSKEWDFVNCRFCFDIARAAYSVFPSRRVPSGEAVLAAHWNGYLEPLRRADISIYRTRTRNHARAYSNFRRTFNAVNDPTQAALEPILRNKRLNDSDKPLAPLTSADVVASRRGG
jgi:hypothetical protein